MRLSRITLQTVEGRRLVPLEHQPRSFAENDVTVRGVRASSEAVCHVQFEATTNYGMVGLLRVSGDLQVEGAGVRELVDTWTTDGALPAPFMVDFQRHLVAAGLNVTMSLARFVGLPSPVSLPPLPSRGPLATPAAPQRPVRDSPEVG